jgi:Lysozyme like domain
MPTINQALEKEYDHKSTLSQREIAELWVAVGGDPSKADLMSAISMAESAGIVRNGNYCCHGLWAFYTIGSTPTANLACALKPTCAAAKAVEVSSNGTELEPWETVENGAYKKFLGKSGYKAGVGKGTYKGEKDQGANGGILSTVPGAETAANAVKSAVSPLSGILGFIGRLFEPSFWLRVGKGIAGFLLLGFGALTLMKVLLGVDVATGAGTAAKLGAGFLA